MSKEKKYRVIEIKLDENGDIEYEKSTLFIMFKFAKAYANSMYHAMFEPWRDRYFVSVDDGEKVVYSIGKLD